MDKNDQASQAADYEAQRDPTYGEYFGFQSDERVFTFSADGAIMTRRLGWLQDPAPAKSPKVSGTQFSIPLQTGQKALRFPLGLIGISGATAAGKSSFVEALSQRRKGFVNRIVAVEPFDTVSDIGRLRAHSSADSALAEAIWLARQNPRQLQVIDSLRAPLFETSGPAGKGGVILPFFTQLTRVSNALAQAGLTVAFTVNPMNEDAEFTASFLSKLSASLPSTILISSVQRTGDAVTRVTGTVSRRPNRIAMPFTFDPKNQVVDSDEELAHAFAFNFEASHQFTPAIPAPLINSNLDAI